MARLMICPLHEPPACCYWPVCEEDQDASFGDLWAHVRRWTGFDDDRTRRLMSKVKIEDHITKEEGS